MVNVIKDINNNKKIIEENGEYYIADFDGSTYKKETKLEGDIDFIVNNFSDDNLSKL